MRRDSLLAPLLICSFGALAYWQGMHGGFIFDDFPNLVFDRDWKVATLELGEWQRAMTAGIASGSGRPFAMLSFAINHYFTGLDPFWMKVTSLGLHLFNAILVYLLCKRILITLPASDGLARLGNYSALAVAMAWALHPLQSSSILYIVQRMEIGAHTGVLLALLCYLRARSNQLIGKPAWLWFALMAVAALFGLGFKESAALIPGYTLALELTLLHFRTSRAQRCTVLIAVYTISAAIALTAYLFLIPAYVSPDAYAFRPFSLTERLVTQIDVLALYVGQALLPSPAKLLFYYDNFPIASLSDLQTMTNLAVLLGLAGSAFFLRRKLPIFSLGIAWFFVAHALTSNIHPLELAFEHRNYFAVLGLIFAAAAVVTTVFYHLSTSGQIALLFVPVAFLAFLSAIQAHTWGDPLRLATVLASRNPDSPRASYELAQQLVRYAGEDMTSPLISLAKRELQHAATLHGSSPLPEQGLIVIAGRSGDPVPIEVWESFREKLTRRPPGPQETAALHGVLQCRLAHACHVDTSQLLDTFLAAVESNPRSASILTLYSGFAFNALGDQELGVRLAREAVAVAPHRLQYRVNLARLLAATERHSEELAGLITLIALEDKHGQYADEIARGFRSEKSAAWTRSKETDIDSRAH